MDGMPFMRIAGWVTSILLESCLTDLMVVTTTTSQPPANVFVFPTVAVSPSNMAVVVRTAWDTVPYDEATYWVE